MRPEEDFVARSMATYFGGYPRARIEAADHDPPDFYLSISGSRIGVEVTRLVQFTFEDSQTFENRNTQDYFFSNLIDQLNARMGHDLPEGLVLQIVIRGPTGNPRRFKRALIEQVTKIVSLAQPDFSQEQKIEGATLSFSVIRNRSSGKRIFGLISNKNASTDVLLNAQLTLDDRIRIKSDRCRGLHKPIWLALLNCYSLADAEVYRIAARQLKIGHCFERIFLVLSSGAIDELLVAR